MTAGYNSPLWLRRSPGSLATRSVVLLWPASRLRGIISSCTRERAAGSAWATSPPITLALLTGLRFQNAASRSYLLAESRCRTARLLVSSDGLIEVNRGFRK